MTSITWNPLALPWLLSGLASLLAILYLVRNWRKSENQWAALAILIALAEWAVAYSVYLSSNTLETQLLWIKIYFIGAAIFPSAFLSYLFYYTDISFPKKKVFIQTVPYLITLVFIGIIFSNKAHQLGWAIPIESTERFALSRENYGIGMWAFIGYAFLTILIDFLLISHSFSKKTTLHRQQAIILTILLLPAVYAVLKNPPLLSLFGGFIALIYTIIIPRVRNLSLLPSYKVATEASSQASIIVDTKLRILDLNQAAEIMLGTKKELQLGVYASQLPQLELLAWNELLKEANSQTKISFLQNGASIEFNLQMIKLENWFGHTAGHIISFRNITRSETLLLELQSKSSELKRNYDLQNTLVQVSTQMGHSTSTKEALEIMSDQMHQIDLEFIIGILDAHKPRMTVEFLSMQNKGLKAAEKLTGIPVIGYQFIISDWPFTDIFEEKKVIFHDNTFDLVHQLMPQIPAALLKQAYRLATVSVEVPVAFIPLFVNEKAVGAIAIWGPRLRQINIDILKLFSSQVASTLENTKRYESEKQINEELSRSKAFVTALNTVATTLSETMDLDIFINSLSETFLELGFGTFLALVDDDEQSATLQYGSHVHPLVKSVQKLIGIDLQGYRVDRRYWDNTVTDLFTGKTLYIDRPIEWASSFIPKLSPKLIEKSLLAIKQRPNDKLILLPILTSAKVLGALAVWGETIQKEDVPTLKLFASQIGSTLQNAHLYQEEQERSAELKHSKSFISALSTVAANIGQTQDLDQITQILGDELDKLGLGNLLVRLNADEETATVYHISTAHNVLQMIKRFTGISLEGYSLKRKHWQKLAEDYFFKGKALFVKDPYEFTSLVIPKMPTKLLRKAIALSEGQTKDKAAYIPLMEGKHAHGILGVWGIDLHEADLPALNVFASQVSAALKSAKKMQEERDEIDRVTRVNEFIRALSLVATQLGTTSKPDEILDILDFELSKLGITFMLTTLDENSQALKIRYTSMEKKWLETAEKLIRRKAIDFPIKKEDFPLWTEVVDGKKSIIIEDALKTAIEGLSSATKIPVQRLESSITALFKLAGWDIISIWHPLMVENSVVGTINFWGPRLQKEDLPVLTVFANQIAATLENARLYEQERQRSNDLAASLAEKNVLLKEVHHRVKNNLQIISSLLNLQTATISNQETLNMFSESRDRIHSRHSSTKNSINPMTLHKSILVNIFAD